jgi:PAS domain S-box-containing protein
MTNQYRWFFGHTVPLKDNQGNILKWIGSASDIQPQKELSFELEALVAERTSELVKLNNVLTEKNEDLARAQNFLQTVLNASVELVTAFDSELNYTFVNNRVRSIFNRNPEDLIGKNLLQVEPDFDKTDSYQHLLRALSGEVVHLESRGPDIDKSLVFETFIMPLKHHGEITGVVTMQRDITAIVSLTEDLKKSNEQLIRSNEDLQQFAHVTSHDLKEPVRKIKMYGNMLLSDYASYLPEKGKEYLTRIEKATGRILSMIDGVLQYSTIEVSDKFLQDIDLMTTIKTIVEDLEVPVHEQNAEIIFRDLPVIKGYSTLIYQLFYNLINNSLKFRRKDVAPVITIRYLPTFEDHEINANYFKMQIEDNGVGFDQAYAERIFESFTRLHPKDRFEGTGLGLALCRKIVLRHSGVIKAVGRPNQGACFNIYLPKAILQNKGQ